MVLFHLHALYIEKLIKTQPNKNLILQSILYPQRFLPSPETDGMTSWHLLLLCLIIDLIQKPLPCQKDSHLSSHSSQQREMLLLSSLEWVGC